MTDLSKITCMVVDNGLFGSIGCVLARTFGKVRYCNPGWRSPFPKNNQLFLWTGYEELEVVESPFDDMKHTDLWVFPDLYHRGEQEALRDMGYPVWGAGAGEALELDRLATKQMMEKRGLPVGPYEVVKGVDKLRDYLKTHKNVWVKLADGRLRGHCETFHSPEYAIVAARLHLLESEMGAEANETLFLVEKPLDHKEEFGIDGYTVDGQFPDTIFFGLENKAESFIGMMCPWKKIPPSITHFAESIRDVLKGYQYRGLMSYENRIGKDKQGYMVDFCARAGSPPNEIYQELYTNLAKIFYFGAQGTLVQPTWDYKYGVQINLFSDFAMENWLTVTYPKDVERWVKLRNAVRVGGVTQIAPQPSKLSHFGAVIGLGNTQQEAEDMAKEIAGLVEADGIRPAIESLDKAEESIAKAKAMGINCW